MTETYEEILNRMKQSFYELAGFQADDASDIGIRLKVLAGELFSIESTIDWMKRQMFPQTASKEQLDYHAQQRGITRKSASKSRGILTFSRNRPITYDIEIPVGTICATPGMDGLRFITLETVVLSTGETSVSASAASVEGGQKYNTSSNAITVMVTPPPGITLVTNTNPFTGGTDQETDEELRGRVLKSYKNLSNGTNAAFYRDFVLAYDGVHSASVVSKARGAGTVDIYIAGKGAVAENALITEIQSAISQIKEINVDIQVKSPTLVTKNVTVSIIVKDGYQFSAVKSACEIAIEEYGDSLEIGEPFLIAALGSVIFTTEGVKNYHLTGGGNTDISGDDTKLITIGTITITEGSGNI